MTSENENFLYITEATHGDGKAENDWFVNLYFWLIIVAGEWIVRYIKWNIKD